MKISHTLFFAILMSICNLVPDQAMAQTEPESVLLFTHQRKERRKFIRQGKTIVYKLKDAEKRTKGKLQAIKDSTIVVEGTEYHLDEFEMIGGRSTGLRLTQVVGGLVMASGAASSGIGLIMISSAQNRDACEGLIMTMVGLVLLTIGVFALILGTIPFFFRARRFDLIADWRVSIAEVSKLKKKRKRDKSE